MQKILMAISSFICLSAAAELSVPPGAVITAEKTIIEPVALAKIEVAELRCILPTGTNTAETVYLITLLLTDGQGAVRRQSMRLTETEADALMASSAHSLSDVVASASAAIQQIVNQRFTSSP